MAKVDRKEIEQCIKEVLAGVNDTEGWTKESEKDGITLWSKPYPDYQVPLTKAQGHIPLPPEFVVHACWDVQFRLQTQDVTVRAEELEVIDDATLIYYVEYKAIPPIAGRDFVCWQNISKAKDGSYVIVLRGTEHEDAPERKGLVRGWVERIGYVVKPVTMPDGTIETYLTMYMLCDPRGQIPDWINKQVAMVQPFQILSRMVEVAKPHSNNFGKFKLPKAVAK